MRAHTHTHTCCCDRTAVIYTGVGSIQKPTSDHTNGLVAEKILLCVLTMCMAAVAVADVDVVDVGVGLQGENEPNQVGSRQQHRDSVHQGPGSKVCLQINTQVTNTWMLENKKKRTLTQYG